MLTNCPSACTEAKLNNANKINNNIAIPDSFYEIKEKDQYGNLLDF